jgi:hypothetical protein
VLLRTLTVAFLGLPVLIFVVGWLRPEPAVLATVALGVALAGLVRAGAPMPAAASEERATISPLSLLAGLAPPVALVLVSGAGGFGPRTWDWLKHDAILKDLIVQTWPVRYATEAGTTGLTYYVAYYLPAAVIGKVAGWAAANVAVVATSLAGVVLATLWLVVLGRGRPLRCGLLLALFSGMDVVGAAIVAPWPPHLWRIFADFHLEWWMGHWQYSSNASLLAFVPNQALAGWLLTALLADAAERRCGALPMVALLTVGVLWSPFAVIGLLPLAIVFVAAGDGSLTARVRAQASWANAGGLLLLGVLGGYYASRLGSLELPARYHPGGAAAARAAFWLEPSRLPLGVFLADYGLFVACEFLVLWLLLMHALRGWPDHRRLRPLLGAAGATLLLLPFFHLGTYNDLVMRASIPALFLLQIGVVAALRPGLRRATSAAIAAVVLVGALYGANLFRILAGGSVPPHHPVAVAEQRSVRNLFQMQLYDPSARGSEFVTQYLGSTDSLFFRHVAPPSAAARVDGPDPVAASGK